MRETRGHRSLRTVEGMDSQVTTVVESVTGTGTWTLVMSADRLHADQGRCVLVNGVQIAIFRIDQELFALDNIDPFSGAPVISRGIIGSVGGESKVASPIYKQAFSLRTGICFDHPTVSLCTYDVRERNGTVEVFV